MSLLDDHHGRPETSEYAPSFVLRQDSKDPEALIGKIFASSIFECQNKIHRKHTTGFVVVATHQVHASHRHVLNIHLYEPRMVEWWVCTHLHLIYRFIVDYNESTWRSPWATWNIWICTKFCAQTRFQGPGGPNRQDFCKWYIRMSEQNP